MDNIIDKLRGRGFDLIYHETKVDDFQSMTSSYMIWMKNRKYFLFECSVEAMKGFFNHKIDINLDLWLKDLTWVDLHKLIELGLPDIQSTIREVRLKKLLDK